MERVANYYTVKQRFVLWILFLVPALLVLAFVVKYANNFPFYDQWELVPYLRKVSAHQPISLSEMAAQHNEHRLLIPRVIMLWLAKLTHWNIKIEIYFGYLVLLMIGILLLYKVVQFYQQQSASKMQYASICAIAMISVLVFSLTQDGNILWGWQIQIFLNILAVAATLGALTTASLSIIDFVLAIASAVVATYTFANGLLIWPIGLAVLLMRWLLHKAPHFLRLNIIWLGCSLLFFYLYLHNYVKPAHHPSLATALYHPFGYIAYVLRYLGNPLIQFRLTHVIPVVLCGALGFIVLIIIIYSAFRNSLLTRPIDLFWHGMLLYSVLSAMITGVGRAGFGSEQAGASRYITISNLFWMWIIVFGVLFIAKNFRQSKTILMVITAGFCLLFIYYDKIVFFDTQVYYSQPREKWKNLLRDGRLNHQNSVEIYPFTDSLIQRNKFLKQQHLSFYY